ncbi:MAG: ABC transporter substrate-binding protein [Planctomycetota bacterium]
MGRLVCCSLLLLLAPAPPFPRSPPTSSPTDSAASSSMGAQPCPRPTSGGGDPLVDAFHPERERAAHARPGGTIRVHIDHSPENLNYALSKSDSNSYLIHEELTDRLAVMDWETMEMRPRIAKSWTIEDVVVLEEDPPRPALDPETPGGARALRAWRAAMSPEAFASRRLLGRVDDLGEKIRVTPIAALNPLTQPIELEKGSYARIDHGMAFTIHLRDDVLWHDGTPLTARDVEFSWSVVRNPYVDAAFMRDYYDLMHYCRALDDSTVRMVYGEQYYQARIFALEALFLIPRHIFASAGQDSPADSEARLREEARHVSEHPANRNWIGNGPYRLASSQPDHHVELVRFEGYWGLPPYLDRIRYRVVGSRRLAYQALRAGELDFVPRAEPEDFFDDAPPTGKSDDFVRALYYYPHYAFIAWNLNHPALRERAVRQALALAFDRQGMLATYSRGCGHLVSGDAYYFGHGYDHAIAPWPHDPEQAREKLDEAGWYDRDEDGLRDKGGQPLAFDFVYPAGSDAAIRYAREMQQAYAAIGIKMTTTPLEWAILLERLTEKQFDACPVVWNMDPESDPHQVWHSSGAPRGARGANYTSFANAEADRLIETGRRTLEDEDRWELWRRLHALLHEEQPVLFLDIKPAKAVYHRRYRGVKFYGTRPGYSLREWFIPEP